MTSSQEGREVLALAGALTPPCGTVPAAAVVGDEDGTQRLLKGTRYQAS